MIIADTNEKDLLNQLIIGDEAAFRQIYLLYSGRLYGNILKLVKSKAVAEEILQEVFIKIWEHRRHIDVNQSFRSYLFRIAENKVCNFYVKASRDRALINTLTGIMSSNYSHVEEAIVSREQAAFLQHAIDTLPPQRKQVFQLCKIEGKSYEEVSALLGISTSTISDHIVKANRFLKEYARKNKELIIILVLILFTNDGGPL
ncbi:hypothetical protein A3860_36985 [Niastella vici]|uniref:RNA polymerase sigma factor n=1 Tax=Niastella vici TaxID=1703345 RepID=A0A1V9FMM3_9BACT|nr:RNA polymerase sigma-70 factor [Niastella vici]OQP59588.1 hypothetical protein A3860_36985 [Niastella vici]